MNKIEEIVVAIEEGRLSEAELLDAHKDGYLNNYELALVYNYFGENFTDEQFDVDAIAEALYVGELYLEDVEDMFSEGYLNKEEVNYIFESVDLISEAGVIDSVKRWGTRVGQSARMLGNEIIGDTDQVNKLRARQERQSKEWAAKDAAEEKEAESEAAKRGKARYEAAARAKGEITDADMKRARDVNKAMGDTDADDKYNKAAYGFTKRQSDGMFTTKDDLTNNANRHAEKIKDYDKQINARQKDLDAAKEAHKNTSWYSKLGDKVLSNNSVGRYFRDKFDIKTDATKAREKVEDAAARRDRIKQKANEYQKLAVDDISSHQKQFDNQNNAQKIAAATTQGVKETGQAIKQGAEDTYEGAKEKAQKFGRFVDTKTKPARDWAGNTVTAGWNKAKDLGNSAWQATGGKLFN